MEIHPIAEVFPELSEDQLQELAADIKREGLLEPIWLFEGKILDGRNRFRACERVNVTPRFRTYDGESPMSFATSMNLRRRHLTNDQRAASAARAMPHFKEEAKKRQGQRTDLKSDNNIREKIPECSDAGRARDHAAKAFDTNPRYVSDAERILKTAPEEFAKMERGEKKLTQINRELKQKEISKRVAEMPSDKFRVIYADPPWKYGDTLGGDLSEGYGGAEKHYPAMSICELCAMPVKDTVDTDAVLFLWVTSPLLFECHPLIKAWGFEYKTSFVWDKVKHNMGHYNSVRHEFLLVCTRGRCTPDVKKLFDSVQSIERSSKHSEKPEAFRQIIDTIYPHGKRLELFARKQSKGWETYGNQA